MFEKLNNQQQAFKNAITFTRRGIIGGLKGYAEPLDNNDWLIQARYILTQTNPDLLKEVLKHEDPYLAYEHGACWMAALLQYEELLPEYIGVLNKTSNEFYYSSLLAGLFLFDAKSVEKHQDELDFDDDTINMSLFCYHVNNELSLDGFNISGYVKKQIIKYFRFSEILRGGCSSDNFQNELSELLHETSPPHKVPLLSLPGNQFVLNQSQKGIYAQHLGGSKEEALKLIMDRGDWQNALAIIESDIQYTLSQEIIVEAYEMILKMIPNSFQLLEEYSVNLLLRGNKFDEIAKEKMEEAERIKAKYHWQEYLDMRYPMRRK